MRDARLLVLASLGDGPKHGYSIQRDIEGFADVRLGPGTLYGAINTLERDGLIDQQAVTERRRPYRITAAGRRELLRHLDLHERIRTRIAAVEAR
jgi:DNA-binding PadR family transcriptional regulator